MSNAKRQRNMAKVKWNEFRKLHSGTSKEEISKLWKDYKAGEYEIPTQEEVVEAVEEVQEEVQEAEGVRGRSGEQRGSRVQHGPGSAEESAQGARGQRR